MDQSVKRKRGNWLLRLSPRKHLDTRLLIWFFAVSLLPLIIIGIVGSTMSKKTGNTAAIRTVSHSFEQQQVLISKYLESLRGQCALLASEASRKAIDLASPFFAGQPGHLGLSDILLISGDGRIFFSLHSGADRTINIPDQGNDGSPEQNLLSRAVQRVQAEKKLVMSEIGTIPGSGGGRFFFMVAPVENAPSGLPVYLACQYPADSLRRMLWEIASLGNTANCYLFDRDKRIILSSKPGNPGHTASGLLNNSKVDDWLRQLGPDKSQGDYPDDKVTLYRTDNGTEILGTISPLKDLREYGPEYFLLQEIGPSDAFGYSDIINFIMIGLIVIIFILVTITSILITRRIIKPINQLSEWARQVALGNLSYVQIRNREDEIGNMTRSFTEVVDSFNEVAEVTEAMAIGDFSKTLRIRCDQDRLGISANQMLSSFNSVIAQTQRISQGDYSADILPRSEKDILGKSLYDMTVTLRDTSAAIRRQDWMKSGMASLSLLMTGDKTLQELTRDVTRFIVTYLDAQMGLFYTVEPDECLQLLSTYAFADRKGNFSRLKIGEGLVGQAALEQQMILFSDIRSEAPSLNYGVNEKIPENFLIAPLVFSGQLTGVLQIGSVNGFTGQHQEFLKQASEPVAVALSTAQSRSKVRLLLEQTQEQAAKLQVQQEELRQTNEELEEQTRALKASEETLQSQQEELRVINEELEERTQTLEEQRDDIRKKNEALEQASREIERKADDLEQASRYKSEFLANMSHELRTPLNSILVLSQLLAENKKKNLTQKQVEFAQTIHSSGADLLELISEILDLSKIEAGKIELHPERIEVNEFAGEIEMQFRPVAEKKGLAFTATVHPATPASIVVDTQRLHQIIRNLMSNAIKFTEKGSISFEVHPVSSLPFDISPNLRLSDGLALSVTDTGIGIPEDKQGVIFEAFHQGDGTTSRKFGGTGLGLTISRSFAALLGGEILIKSKPGSGSTFTLVIPVNHSHDKAVKQSGSAIIHAPVTADEGNSPGGNASVAIMPHHQDHYLDDDRDIVQQGEKILLIIEDDLSFAGILRDMAHEKGFRCLVAPDGESGLHLADFYTPSAIILDIGLPGIDGWTVMDRLKHNPATRHIPVHFISADEKSTEALKMGAIGYLTKPVSLEKIETSFGRIEEVISKPVKRLLVAEDDMMMQKIIVDLIGGRDVKTTAVSKGAEVIQLLGTESFDCMILDLGLEDMTGFELIEQIRTRKEISYLPIIIYTGRELTKAEEEQLRQYADSIIIKGIRSPERLLAESTLFLHRVETNLPKEKQEMLKMMYNREDVFQGKTVMLVDDDSRNLFALSSVLEEKGMGVITAGNGLECLEKLKSKPKIDAILMDVMMPEMDGFEAMGHIRKMEHYAKTPVIALTAKAMKEDRERCIDAGANDYLSKPVDGQKLLSLLRVWLYR